MMNQQALGNFLFKAVGLCFVLNALQAYAVGPVPIPWFANALMLVVFSIFAFNFKFRMAPGLRFFSIFIFWLLLDYLAVTLLKGIPGVLPGKATLSYVPYISLRFVTFFTFAAAVMLIFWLQEKHYSTRLIDLLISLGVWVAFYALYVYFAQLNGLPEIPRNRIGTSGEEQAVAFNYAFHRAMGPFREPSHLAEWLLVPLFLSLWKYEKVLNWRTCLLAVCLLLTASLSGISAFLGGLAIAFLLNLQKSAKFWLQPVKIVSAVCVAVTCFGLFVGGKKKESSRSGSLGTVLWERVEPIIFEKGLKSSNRDYVYIYAEQRPLSLFGSGLGNANIEFSRYTGSSATASFLSLYLYVLYSSGLVGLVLLILFLGFPIVYFLLNRFREGDPKNHYILAGYLAWLIGYAVHSEELSLHFAFIYCILVGLIYFGTDETKNSNHL